MDTIQYVGEHLWPGRIGHFCLLFSFCTALFSAYAFKQSMKDQTGWKRLARISFSLHGITALVLIGCIFFVMYNKMYEYRYVVEHVSDDLPMRYILSAFWEGQEGSFLLWIFWHIILGWVCIGTNSRFEGPVMCVISMIQVVLLSMILGVYIGLGDWVYKLGSNPILLLRDTVDLPIFNNAEYVSLLEGNGLNLLLQNYWMTIHPPITFLGFASTAFPFAFAIAGLWTGEHKNWLLPGLKWSLFSACILGTGILMGGAWAYEALTFGGYWAWDPVENTSLVPWLIIVAGIHTNLVSRSTGYSIRSTYFFCLLYFPLIIYSTFLTRSGILGETSVHAFTEMGLELQLVFLVLSFTFLGFFAFAKAYKSIPAPTTEEAFLSREFWMFIGALVLLFSGALISFSSSLPVFNKIIQYFDPGYIGKVINDPIPHYNKYQIWIAVFISLLSAVAIFLRYGKPRKNLRPLLIHLGTSTLLALVATFLFEAWLNLYVWQYKILMFTSAFTVFANLNYIISFLKGNLKLGASALSHIGFGLMIIGVLASGLNQTIISSNRFAMTGIMEEEKMGNTITLYEKLPMFMNGYWVNYSNDTLENQTRTYQLDFRRVDENNVTQEEFSLFPNVMYEKDFSKVAANNPDTRHYWDRDVFIQVAGLPPAKRDIKFAHEMEDTLNYIHYEISVGDSFELEKNMGILESIDFNPKHLDYSSEDNDLGIGLTLKFKSKKHDSIFVSTPALGLNGNLIYQYPDKLNRLNMKVMLEEKFFEQIFTAEEVLEYESFSLKQGESYNLGEYRLKLIDFDRQAQDKNYEAEEGDIAIAAEFELRGPEGVERLKPIYVLRGNRSFGIKAYNAPKGIHLRFVNIDPTAESFDFKIATDDRNNIMVPLKIAENVPATDYIAMEAKIFPGINLFWLGAILMMFGLGLGFAHRRQHKK